MQANLQCLALVHCRSLSRSSSPIRRSHWRSRSPGERIRRARLVARRRCGHGHRNLVDALHRHVGFLVPIPLRYNIVTTLVSLIIAILTSGFALAIASRPNLASSDLPQARW